MQQKVLYNTHKPPETKNNLSPIEYNKTFSLTIGKNLRLQGTSYLPSPESDRQIQKSDRHLSEFDRQVLESDG